MSSGLLNEHVRFEDLPAVISSYEGVSLASALLGSFVGGLIGSAAVVLIHC